MVESLIEYLRTTWDQSPWAIWLSLAMFMYAFYLIAMNYITKARLLAKLEKIGKEKLELKEKLKEIEASIVKKSSEIKERMKRE